MIQTIITINGAVGSKKELKLIEEGIYVLSSTECYGCKIGRSHRMYERLKKLVGKVLSMSIHIDVFKVSNSVKWERFIHSWLRNHLIAGEVFDLDRSQTLAAVQQCFSLPLDSNVIVPTRSRYFLMTVNGVPQVSLPTEPHIVVLSVPSIPRVVLCRPECPRTWFDRFTASSLHTHWVVDAFNVRLLAINTVQSIVEELGAIRLAPNGTIDRDRETVVSLIARHVINHVNEE